MFANSYSGSEYGHHMPFKLRKTTTRDDKKPRVKQLAEIATTTPARKPPGVCRWPASTALSSASRCSCSPAGGPLPICLAVAPPVARSKQHRGGRGCRRHSALLPFESGPIFFNCRDGTKRQPWFGRRLIFLSPGWGDVGYCHSDEYYWPGCARSQRKRRRAQRDDWFEKGRSKVTTWIFHIVDPISFSLGSTPNEFSCV